MVYVIRPHNTPHNNMKCNSHIIAHLSDIANISIFLYMYDGTCTLAYTMFLLYDRYVASYNMFHVQGAGQLLFMWYPSDCERSNRLTGIL